jgi:anhydro-N-acetylmuramic acid kinase
MAWFIGLMSGTSLDGVDGVLAEVTEDVSRLRSHAHVQLEFPAPLRAELLALNRPGADELHRAALAANALVGTYADVVAGLLARGGIRATQVAAIGAHGQTVRHCPQAHAGTGYTLQLMNGALLAERTGIDVVCDFRSRDVAAGGQGAPLAPGFHLASFGQPGVRRVVLNLGGMANLTLLRGDGSVLGFDCGPGNVLMDGWCQRHRGQAYDAGGAWAAGGRADAALLQSWLADPYFAVPPPKSTGRDLFDMAWLDARLDGPTREARDVMATLAELTAHTVAHDVRLHAPGSRDLFVCGGGAFNTQLLQRLSSLLPQCSVQSTAALGIEPDQVEALAFAWLAQVFLARRPGNLPAVTGACGPRVLGALYPAA